MGAEVVLTFDFDAESPWLQDGVDAAARDLTQLSLGEYGSRRGIERIGEVLAELELPATVFVPGWTADAHPDQVRELARMGHEIGHHGYHHVPPVALPAAGQREELVRGIEAIERSSGSRPIGYRSPSWQLTPITLEALSELGFAYDSSCMGDDRPYLLRAGDHEILELPVHWTLDDFPHLGWSAGSAGPLRDPAAMFATWRREVEIAATEGRPIVLTGHPEIIGRPGPAAELRRFLAELRDDGRFRFSRCAEVAHAYRDQAAAPSERSL